MTRVALVVLDTLRKDAFNEYFDWLPGTRYSNTWSPSHGTVQVHGSLFSGLYASEHGVTPKSPTFNLSRPTLAEHLSTSGVKTRAFSSNTYVSPAFEFDRGFESFTGNYRVKRTSDQVYDWNVLLESNTHSFRKYFRGLMGSLRSDNSVESLRQGALLKAEGEGWWQPTDKGAKQANKWADLQTYSDDEFVFINLMEAHSPYLQIPDEYHQEIPEESVPRNPNIEQVFDSLNEESVRAAYEAGVSYLSDSYESLFERLISEMDYVITMADHGEMLGETGLWGHDHGVNTNLVHVPLVISDGSGDTQTDERLVSSLDVHQTVLDLFDITGESRGVSLFSSEERKACLTECLGLPPGLLDKFGDAFPIDEYDINLRGLAMSAGYGYETRDRWVQTRTSDSAKFKKLLNEQIELLDTNPNERYRIDENMRSHLVDLGYA